MRNTFICIIITLFAFNSSFSQEKLTSFVDPFIGTSGKGHTFPGAVVPFGMVQLSPDNGRSGTDWSSGYQYSSNEIVGFSHMHLSGSKLGDWLDISVMPLSSPLRDQDTVFKAATFLHENEKASPGYYTVKLDNGIQVELTTTERVGYHRYTFPAGTEPVIRFDLAFHQNTDIPTETFIKKVNDSTLIGYRYSTGLANQQRVYFAAQTSRPFSEFHLKGEIGIEVGDINVGLESNEKGKGVSSQLIFMHTDFPEAIELKVALSMTGTDKALLAFDEIPHWNFNEVRAQADANWEKELNKVHIRTSDLKLKKIFYTSLYHTAIAPALYSDADGEYKNAKDEKHVMANGGSRYTLFSLWNSFRALNPLFTITQPDRYTDMLNSMLAFYDENGTLPVWELGTSETNAMTGHHAISVLSDAILKDWPGLDQEKAYEAMKKSALQPDRNVPDYIQYGYVPQDKSGQSVSMTLEYGYNDWCIAAVANKLGKQSDYDLFSKRALAYMKVFDMKTGFMRAKNSDSSWTIPFNPNVASSDPEKDFYTEGNAWENTFFVPHDIRGLQNLYGSTGLEEKLDMFFSLNSMTSKSSYSIPYLYSFIGKPWKTQALVRQILESKYHDKPDGYAESEGNGQASAWAVWNIIGFYPVNPAGGNYILGSPMVDGATIQLNNNKFEIEVLNNSLQNKYIQSVELNGTVYKKSYLSHKDLLLGGKMIVNMGPEPNLDWGSNESWLPSLQSAGEQTAEEIPERNKKGIFKSISDFFNNLFK